MWHAPDLALVDAHVHFHPCFERARFLAAAAANFARSSRRSGRLGRCEGALLLTEVAGRDVFGEWTSLAEEARSTDGWRFHATGEACSLLASRDAGEARVVIVAGRQIRSREGLEVLAHGTTREVPDGLPFREALERACRLAPLVSIPWGFGKWWFRRGRMIEEVVANELPQGAFLADNGCRQRWMSGPEALRAARAGRKRPILAGSDPLPFADHEGRAGSFGFAIRGGLGERNPLEDLALRMREGASVETYGSRRGISGFVVDQIRLRVGSDLRANRP